MISYRKILPSDNKAISQIVIDSMTEFGADPKTTIIGDPSVHTMFENFQSERAVYYVAEEDGKILGGSGIHQLDGTDENICELQRMFLVPEARGKGIGKKLMEMCTQAAKDFGYEKIYLETLSNMDDARKLYLKSGFALIPKPLGNTGHGGCNAWMVLQLKMQNSE